MIQKINPYPALGYNRSPPLLCIFKRCNSRQCSVHFFRGPWLRCLLYVKGLVIGFYLGWSGSILQFRKNIIKVGSKPWLLTWSSNITLSLPSDTGSALNRELNLCNVYLSLLYFWLYIYYIWMTEFQKCYCKLPNFSVFIDYLEK